MAPLVKDSSERIPALDGLRGLAMLAVVGCHLVWPDPTLHFDRIDRVLVNGWVGVDLFFVLSGFLITGILIDSRDRSGYLRTFYTRRALRIFPIYYLLLVVLFIWIPFGEWWFAHGLSGEYQSLAANQRWYWTYAVNVMQARQPRAEWFWTGHLWSLSVEEQFYLVWPAVVLLVSRRRLALACVAAIVGAFALRVWWVLTQPEALGAYVLTPMRMDSLAAGALVATLARSERGSQWLRRTYRWIGASALAVLLPLHALHGADLQNVWMTTAGYAMNALGAATLIVWLIADPRPRAWLEWRPLRAAGRVSYGAYLYHLPLIGLMVPLRDRLQAFASGGTISSVAAHGAWIATILVLTLLVASASFRWIERPFLELKTRRAGVMATRVL